MRAAGKAVVARVVVAVEPGDDIVVGRHQVDQFGVVVGVVLVEGEDRMVGVENDLLAVAAGVLEGLLDPAELFRANAAVPGLAVWLALRLQFGTHLLGECVVGGAFGVAVGADVIRVHDDESPAVAAEVMVGRRHLHGGQHVLAGHLEVVVAEHVVLRHPQLLPDRHHSVEAFGELIDEVAQVQREPEVFLVQGCHRFLQLADGLPVEPDAAVGLVGVLAVGNDSEAQRRFSTAGGCRCCGRRSGDGEGGGCAGAQTQEAAGAGRVAGRRCGELDRHAGAPDW